MMFGTYVASRSVMFERSSPVIAEENAQQPRLFLCTFLSTKIYSRRGVFNAYLQILLLDFSP